MTDTELALAEVKKAVLMLLQLHSLVEHLVFQYFSISSAVLPGILPAIRDHLIKLLKLEVKYFESEGSLK
jgi:hypothetical protein